MLEGSVREGVEILGGLLDTENVALLGVKFHAPIGGPGFKVVLKVFLEIQVVLEGVDFAV